MALIDLSTFEVGHRLYRAVFHVDPAESTVTIRVDPVQVLNVGGRLCVGVWKPNGTLVTCPLNHVYSTREQAVADIRTRAKNLFDGLKMALRAE